MGMYTEFVFAGALHDDVPDNVVAILRYLITPSCVPLPEQLPSHPFFNTDRWDRIAVSKSCYFGYNRAHSPFVHDDINHHWMLSIRSNLKNYHAEIETFVDWVRPYIRRGSGGRDFLGYSIYEEEDAPTLYYLQEGI
jgi:hypothetical protein